MRKSFIEQIREDFSNQVCGLLREVFETGNKAFTHEVAWRAEEWTKAGALASPQGPKDEWALVESLSGLRALVGGRFANLKKRWTDAGLPLRESSGYKGGTWERNDHAWIALCQWINQQGFEVRLGQGSGQHFFEIRKIS